MEEFASTFPYLGEDMLQQTLATFAQNMQKCFVPGTEGYNNLAETTKKLQAKRERWPEKIFQLWKSRDVPVFSPESITKINQAFIAWLENVNEQRRRVRESLKNDIVRLKKKIDDLSVRREKSEEIYNSAELLHRTEQSLLNRSDHSGFNRLQAILNSAYDSYVFSINRISFQEQTMRRELDDLERDIAPIRLLSTQSNQKHLVITKHNSLLGWIPSEDQYVLIQNSKPPSSEEILRRVSHEPETGLTNLPLSIFNLIHFADEIGGTDTVLLSMITHYLKKYKSHILDILDTKKLSLTAIIEILSFHCTTDHEKSAVLQKLRQFKRDVSETFASAATRFESLYVFYLQLDTPSTADTIRLMSYQVLKQISQYLLSPKCGQAFGHWVTEQQKMGGEITKESIIRVITQLEIHPDLRLHSSRQLPGSLITTTLNLPLGESDVNINAHFTNPAPPVDLIKAKTQTPARSLSGSRARSTSGKNDKNQFRKPSKSPNRGKKEERGRSPDKRAPERSSTRAYSVETDSEMDCLQYYSRYSQSPNPVRKQSMPSIFRRPLTPRSQEHLKKTYFFETSGAKRFKDVREKGFCLRCYGRDHRANACKIYTRPTPAPCKFCFHLFHSPEECRFYTSEGKTRPPSLNRAPK
jgi:hypothetical protein